MLRTALTCVLGAFYTLIGCVKCGGGVVLAPVFAMQREAIMTRYQPGLASLSFLPLPISTWLRGLPVETFMMYIGVPELAFGLVMALTASPLGKARALASVADMCNVLMIGFMVGPITAHLVGDDFSLPLDSNVGPAGVVPAAVFAALLLLRLVLRDSRGKEKAM